MGKDQEKRNQRTGEDPRENVDWQFQSTHKYPYYGILMETGIWPVDYRIHYATLMYYHSIINPDDLMLTRIVLEQEKNQLPNTS